MKTIFDKSALFKAAGTVESEHGLEIPELEQLSNALTITSIAMVGFDNCFRDDGRLENPSELCMLIDSLSTLCSYNIGLADDLEAHLINGHKMHGGRDFFEEEQSFDLILLSAIFFPDHLESVPNHYVRDDSPLFYMSQKGTSRKAWVQKSENLGAKLVFSDSYSESITNGDFSKWGNFTVLKTDRGFCETGCAVHKPLLKI